MVAGVDNHVGDTISVTFRSGETRDVIGYITNDADAASVEGLNPQRIMWHCEIAKAALPEGIAAIAFLTNRRLSGRYKPGANSQAQDGTDYLFDLQKV